MTLRGKVVLLTGATGGIGRPTALLLALEGARLALTARSEGPLRALVAEVIALGGEAAGFPADLRRAPDCARLVEETVGRFGGLDAVVNNAGVSILREAAEATDAEIEEMIDLDLLATIRVTRAEGGRRALRHQGVRFTLYLPAAVETPLLDRAPRDRALGLGPAGVVLRPEEAAAAIVRSLKRHPADVYSPFWNRWLAWLNLVAPALSDRILNALFRYPRKK